MGTAKHPLELLVQPPVWSLALEIYFYLLCPFLTKAKSRDLLFLIAICIMARVIGYELGWDANPYHARFFPFEIVFFLMGIMAYRLYASQFGIAKILRGWWGIAFAVFYIMGITFFNDIVKTIPVSSIYSHEDYLHSLTICALTVPALVALFQLTITNRADRFIGEMSYPIYIIHYAYVSTLLHTKLAMPFGISSFWMILFLTLLSAVLIHFLVQVPVDKYREMKFVSNQNN